MLIPHGTCPPRGPDTCGAATTTCIRTPPTADQLLIAPSPPTLHCHTTACSRALSRSQLQACVAGAQPPPTPSSAGTPAARSRLQYTRIAHWHHVARFQIASRAVHLVVFFAPPLRASLRATRHRPVFTYPAFSRRYSLVAVKRRRPATRKAPLRVSIAPTEYRDNPALPCPALPCPTSRSVRRDPRPAIRYPTNRTVSFPAGVQLWSGEQVALLITEQQPLPLRRYEPAHPPPHTSTAFPRHLFPPQARPAATQAQSASVARAKAPGRRLERVLTD